MNYLTMVDAGPSKQPQVGGNEALSGITKLDNNIYSIPLFYNDFYENADADITDDCDVRQDVTCSHGNGTQSRPEPCGTSRYIPDICRRHITGNSAGTFRDSGTDTLYRNSGFSDVEPRQDITHVYANDIQRPNTSIKPKTNKRLCRTIAAAMLVGVVLGITVCSVTWLTVDKLRSDNVRCVLQNSLTLTSDDVNVTVSTPYTDSSRNTTAATVTEVTTNNGLLSSILGVSTTAKSSSTTSRPATDVTETTVAHNSFSVPSTMQTPTPQRELLDTSTYAPNNQTQTSSVSLTSLSNRDTTQNVDGLQNPGVTDHVTSTSSSLTPSTESTSASLRDVTSTSSNLTPSTESTSSSFRDVTSTSSNPPSSSDLTSEPTATSHDVTSNSGPVHAGLVQTTAGPNVTKDGHVYVRWGREDCPDNSRLLYTGIVGGGHYVHSGGAASNLCLPSSPTWGGYDDVIQADRNLLHITEYESSDTSFNTIMGRSLHNQNVPCAVCQASGRNSFIMIPGRTECLQGWSQEYTGYLMGGRFDQPHGKSVICVDKDPQTVTGGSANEDGNLLYFVEFRGTNTVNYVNGRELACTVCTR